MDTNVPPSQRLDPYAHGLGSGRTDLFSYFLGAPARPEKTNPYAKRASAKMNMPEAYWGENLYLGETVIDWMFTKSDFYTTRIMPYRYTEQIHIQWEQWEHNATFFGLTPHQAPSNIVTSQRTIHGAKLKRIGLGAEFELDFLATAVGRTQFLAALRQLVNAARDTANVGVIQALYNCHDYTQLYLLKHGVIRKHDLEGWLERDAENFMCAQKQEYGLEKLNTRVSKEQEMYEGKANAWLFGRDMMDYIKLNRPEKNIYSQGGQEAINRINDRRIGPAAASGTAGSVSNIEPMGVVSDAEVFIVRSYHVDGVGTLELLSRTVEKGVFNTMIDKTRDFAAYTTASRNLLVYDNEFDDWAEIRFRDAIENCVIWDTDGDVHDPFGGTGKGGRLAHKTTLTDSNVHGQNDFLRYANGSDETAKDVLYMGDFDSKWCPIEHYINAGITVLAAYRKITGKTDAINSIEALFEEKKSLPALESLLGDDNAFLRDKGKFKDLVEYKAVATKSNISSQATIGSEASALVESSVSKFFNEVIGQVVSDELRPQFREIAGQTNLPWEERAKKVEAFLQDNRTTDTLLQQHFKTSARVTTYIDRRIADYSTQYAKDLAEATASTAPSTTSTVGENIIHVPIGSPLPQGYTYLNAQEEAKARSGVVKQCPTSLYDFPFLSHLFEGGQQEMGMGGARRARNIESTAGTLLRGGGEGEKKEQLLNTRYIAIDRKMKEIASQPVSQDVRYMAMLYLTTRFTKKRLLALADHNISVMVNFLLLRTHATYRTSGGIKCATDGECGYTYVGHQNMMIDRTASIKTGVLHQTMYMTSIVHNPRNVYVINDIYCQRYLGGMGTKFWTVTEYHNKAANRRKKDIICTMLPPHMPEKMKQVIDVRGQFLTQARLGLVDPDSQSTFCYPGAARTAYIMQWQNIAQGRRSADPSNRGGGIDINYICWQGVQFSYNTSKGDWGDCITEKGHFGENVYPGCGRVRNGHDRTLRAAPYLGQNGIKMGQIY